MEIYGKDFDDCLLVNGSWVVNGEWEGKFTPDGRFYFRDPEREQPLPLLMKVPPELAKGKYGDIISACRRHAREGIGQQEYPLPPFDPSLCTCSVLGRHAPCSYCESGMYTMDGPSEPKVLDIEAEGQFSAELEE